MVFLKPIKYAQKARLRAGRPPRVVGQVQEGEGQRPRIAGLRLQARIVDRAPVQPRRRARFQAAQRKACRVQRRRQRACTAALVIYPCFPQTTSVQTMRWLAKRLTLSKSCSENSMLAGPLSCCKRARRQALQEVRGIVHRIQA